jgi:hypothetical protein
MYSVRVIYRAVEKSVTFKQTKLWLNAAVTESQKNDATQRGSLRVGNKVSPECLALRQMSLLPSCLSRARRSKNKKVTDLYKGINTFRKGYRPRTRLTKDGHGDLLADSHNILKKRNYFSHSKNKNVRNLYIRINTFRKGYRPRTRLTKDWHGDLLADSHNILKKWNYFSHSKNKNVRELHKGINMFRRCRVVSAADSQLPQSRFSRPNLYLYLSQKAL